MQQTPASTPAQPSPIAERQVSRFRAFLEAYVERYREATSADWLYTDQQTFTCPRCGDQMFNVNHCAECGVIQ